MVKRYQVFCCLWLLADLLYSDGGAMWFITHWDIRYVPCSQISDHFHLDHKDYYESFVETYRYGSTRVGSISDMN